MKNVLVLNASLNGDQGNSNVLSQKFTDLLGSNADVQVTQRDLNEDNLAHLNGQEMAAWMTEPAQRTAEQAALAQVSDELIEEVKANELIVIGMPMYNFGIPSTFKTWIDRIARAGVTFKYTDKGPVGLLENKKVVILAARGGVYQGTPKDTQTQYLKDFFAFVGIEDVSFVYAEGLNMGLKEEAFAKAEVQMSTLANSLVG